ncbi:hypothetical protein [Chryseobacterium indologenes]|uniref:hypothetical protein n=1 Tax=Chryseobacterium indologenes TaxID=253 RepID=UPI000A8EB053|nr:hypothetical protein [Chryseobacterium indologenes]
MTILHHPQNDRPPKVYDKEDHQNYAKWCLIYLHRNPSKSEMESTRKNFTYDMDYYLSLPNPSKNIEIL